MMYLAIGLFIATAITALVYAMKKEYLTEGGAFFIFLLAFFLGGAFLYPHVFK